MDCKILGKFLLASPILCSVLQSSSFWQILRRTLTVSITLMKPCLVLISRLRGGECSHYSAGRPSLRPILPTCCYSHQLTLLSDNAGNSGFVLHFCLTMSKIFQFCRDMIVLTSSFTLSDYKYEFL